MSDKFNIEKMLNSVGNEEVPDEISDLSTRIISEFGRAVEVAESGQSYKSRFVSWLGGLCYHFAAGAAFALVIIAASCALITKAYPAEKEPVDYIDPMIGCYTKQKAEVTAWASSREHRPPSLTPANE